MNVQPWTIKDIKKCVEALGRHYDVWNLLPPIEKLVLQPLSNEPRELKFWNMRSIAFLAKDDDYKIPVRFDIFEEWNDWTKEDDNEVLALIRLRQPLTLVNVRVQKNSPADGGPAFQLGIWGYPQNKPKRNMETTFQEVNEGDLHFPTLDYPRS